MRVLSKDLEGQYRELERKVEPQIVERAYQAIDALLAGLEEC